MKPSRIVVVGLVLACLVAGAVWFYRGAAARERAPSDRLRLYGNVDVRQVELGFRVAGRLDGMRFEEGESVDAGVVLATLDTSVLQNQLAVAQAQEAVQAATLQKVVAGSRPQEIVRARATVEEARAAERIAHTELGRMKNLVDANARPAEDYDNALAASQETAARLSAAEESLRLVVEGSRSEDIVAARATLQAARANVALAQTALSDATLYAPHDGVVTSRVREPGAIVSPNDAVYVLSLTGQLWVRAYVSEKQLGAVRPGMAANVLTDAAGAHPYRAHVGYISPVAEFTPKSVETPELRTDLVYRVRVVVDEAAPALRQGMPVTLEIPLGGG